MKLSGKRLNDIKDQPIGITIGSFDGVHRGHQFVLCEFVEKCKERNLIPVVVSFSPHPLVVIKQIDNYLIDSSHKKRLYLKSKFNIELIEIEFNKDIRDMSGETFFEKLQFELTNIKLLYAGHDFSLGKGKEFSLLEAKRKLEKVEIYEGEKFKSDSCEFSSTTIRESLLNGNIHRANFLLGHPFKLTATVMNGNKIGRTIGFPTANLSFCKTQILPQDGVYFAKTTLKNKKYKAIVNIGVRPTVTDNNIRIVEVNIFDFDGNIYGDEIDVEFYQKIRDEKKFESIEKLRSQISKDIETCKELYYYDRFGLIGRDISHSKSPQIYAELLSNNDLDYKLYDFDDETNIELKSILNETKYINVTSPYKKICYDLCDEILVPSGIHSINCLKLESDKIIGTNTDLHAIKEIINNLLCKSFSQILVLGNGAMSELLNFVLDQNNLNFEVLSRKNNKLQSLNTIVGKNILIINATAREFTPDVSKECTGTFWDLNYDQSYANDFKLNKKLKYIDGKGLLMLQAKYALSFWNLKRP